MEQSKGLYFGLLVLANVLLMGCTSSIQCSSEDLPRQIILAKIGDHTITMSNFEERLNDLPTHYQKRLEDKEQRIKFLEQLVEVSLCSIEAGKKGMDKDKLIQSRIRNATDNILAREYIKREVIDKITISDKEVEEYYKTHLQEFTRPEQVKARHILIKASPKAESEEWTKALARAQELKRQLDKGADFVTLAKEYSDDLRSKRKGGYLGLINRGGKFGPEFSQIAFTLDIGEVSDPVKTSQGYHIIKVEDKRPEMITPLDKVKGGIEAKLRSAKEKTEVEEAIECLKEKYEVVLYTELLSSENTTGEKVEK